MLNCGSRLGCPDIVSAAGAETFVRIIDAVSHTWGEILTVGIVVLNCHMVAWVQGNARVPLWVIYLEDLLGFIIFSVQTCLQVGWKGGLTFSWRVPPCLCEGRSSVWACRKRQRGNLMVQSHHSGDGKQVCHYLSWELFTVFVTKDSHKEHRSTVSDHYRVHQCCRTLPLGRPRSFRAWKIPFSVFPDANVRVMLWETRREQPGKD